MFTGALAASYYGTPRTTMDVDIIVKVSREEPQTKLISALRETGLQVDEKQIEAAFKSGFKIATFSDTKSPFTVDIIFSRRKLEKRAGTILGLPTFYQTPEELTLTKLRIIKETRHVGRAVMYQFNEDNPIGKLEAEESVKEELTKEEPAQEKMIEATAET